MNEPGVEYRDVAGFLGYKVGNDGSIWSAWDNHRRLTGRWKRLKGVWHGRKSKQYLTVALYAAGVRKYKKVHIAVLEAFVGPRPVGMEGCHKNDNTAENHVANPIRSRRGRLPRDSYGRNCVAWKLRIARKGGSGA